MMFSYMYPLLKPHIW